MTAHLPRVSVGMPVYNGERYVKEAIDSVLSQTFTDFELVISDNASTDRTQEICESYCSRDPRIRYSRNPRNVGGSQNFTRVFELSRAPYFKWASHDDLCAPSFLEKSVEVLDAHPSVVLCYPRSALIDQYGAVIADHEAGCDLRSGRSSDRVRQLLMEGSTHCFPSFGLIRREALKKTTLLAPYISSDQPLLLQLAIMGKFYELTECLFFFREHPERSVWQSKTFAERLAWYDPKRGSGIQLPRWRVVFEFLRSIAGAEINWREAWASYLLVMKWCRWHRAPLIRDLSMAARQLAAIMFGLPAILDQDGSPPVKGATGFHQDSATDTFAAARSASGGDGKV